MVLGVRILIGSILGRGGGDVADGFLDGKIGGEVKTFLRHCVVGATNLPCMLPALTLVFRCYLLQVEQVIIIRVTFNGDDFFMHGR